MLVRRDLELTNDQLIDENERLKKENDKLKLKIAELERYNHRYLVLFKIIASLSTIPPVKNYEAA